MIMKINGNPCKNIKDMIYYIKEYKQRIIKIIIDKEYKLYKRTIFSTFRLQNEKIYINNVYNTFLLVTLAFLFATFC